jgi:hypothetical protein
MKTLIIAAVVLAGVALLVVLNYAPTPAYYLPMEPMPDGSGRRIPDDRLPPMIDKLEVVLKQEGIRYRREGPARLYFKTPPAPAQLREWEVKAGIRSP